MVKPIDEPADYEHTPEKCHITAEQLRTALFCESSACSPT
jgi:hypothetical protein